MLICVRFMPMNVRSQSSLSTHGHCGVDSVRALNIGGK
jgi:hypothetical protein